MLTYVPLLIAFVGASLGLTGSAWDSTNKKGRIKFTKRGWLSLTILSVGLSLSVYSTYKTNRAADYEKCQRSLVKKLAYNETRIACVRLAAPFIDMYRKHSSTSLDTYNPESLDALIGNLRVFGDVDLYEKPPSDLAGFDDADYFAALTRVSKTTPPRLQEIVKTYSYYLDGEDIVWMDDVSGHAAWFDHLPDIKKTVGVFYYFDDEDQTDHLKEFFPKLKELWRKVEAGSAYRESLAGQRCTL